MDTIERDLLSHISVNWSGRFLISHNVLVNLIGANKTSLGAFRQPKDPTRVKLPDADMKSLNRGHSGLENALDNRVLLIANVVYWNVLTKRLPVRPWAVLGKFIFCTTNHNLTRCTVCLLMLATCSNAYSSGTRSVECAELLRDGESSEVVSVGTTKANRGDAIRREPETRMGPLTVSTVNPRYFSDPSGHAVYLTGAHTWNNLVDMDSQFSPHAFNFDAYLDFLKAHNHNLIRLWAWEVTRPNDDRDTPLRKVVAPQPWSRTGPGTDITGLPKFDLTKLNPEYFQRLRARVEAARDRGLYVSIMLFEGWSVQFSPGRLSHPFYGSNNINEH